jgi:hypothetical protein
MQRSCSIDPVDFDRSRSLIPGGSLGTIELQLKKEEWVSVLKLSTIWDMTKVCRTQSVTQGTLALNIIN